MKNMKIFKTWLLVGSLALVFFLSSFSGQSYVFAASEPSLKEVRSRKTTELKLPIKYEKYAKKDVTIKLYAINTRTGKEMVSTHDRELDKDGKVVLRVKNLEPGTVYKFKVKIKKESGGSYSDKSDTRKGSTKMLGSK